MAASRRGRGPAWLLPLVLVAVGCASPEAERARGGGAGGDPGNVGAEVEMHAGSRPYHGTPCLGDPAACAAEQEPERVARR